MSQYLDIASVPRRSFFELLACLSCHELEREKLLELSSAQGQEDLCEYCTRPRRTVLEVRAGAAGRAGGCGRRAAALLRLSPPGAVRLPTHGWRYPPGPPVGPHPPDPAAGLLHCLFSAGEGPASG